MLWLSHDNLSTPEEVDRLAKQKGIRSVPDPFMAQALTLNAIMP